MSYIFFKFIDFVTHSQFGRVADSQPQAACVFNVAGDVGVIYLTPGS